MLRKISIVLMLAIYFIAGAPMAVEAAPNINVVIDGMEVQFPDQKPFINEDGRTMVPVRAPMEAIGCTVAWDDGKKQAIITRGDTVATFTIGSKNYTVNGSVETMDTVPEIANDRTVFPIRFCAEAFGAEVGWDPVTYTVSIKTGTKEIVINPYVLDIPKSNNSSQTDTVKVENYNIMVTNLGVYDQNIWFSIIDQGAYQPKAIKVICTSNPELNEHNTMFIDGQRRKVDMTQWTRQGYDVFKDNYSKNPKSGDTLVFDVYGKIDGKEVKMVTVKKTLP